MGKYSNAILKNRFILYVFFLFIFYIIFQLIFSKAMFYASGDASSMILLAEYMKNSNIPITEYAMGNELKFFYPAIYYAIGMYFFDDYNNVWIFGNTLGHITILLAYIFLIKQFKLDFRYGFLAAFICLLPLSNHWVYIGILASFYNFNYLYVLILFALIFSISKHNNIKIQMILIFLYTFVSFVSAFASNRTLVVLFIPLILSLACMLVIYKIKKYDIKMLVNIFFVSVYGFIISILSYILTDKIVRLGLPFRKHGVSLLDFTIEKSDFIRLIQTYKATFSIYKWDDILSVISNIAIIISLLLFFYMVYKLIRYHRNPMSDLLILYMLIGLSMQFVLIILYKGYVPRYMFPILVIFPVIFIMFTNYFHPKIIDKVFIIFLLFHSVVVLYYTFDSSNWTQQSTFVYKPNVARVEKNEIFKYIIDSKIDFGYAWHDQSHCLHAITNGDISVGSVYFDYKRCDIRRWRYDTFRSYFQNNKKDKPAFLIIPVKFYNICEDKNNFLKENKYIYKNNKFILYYSTKNNLLKYIR